MIDTQSKDKGGIELLLLASDGREIKLYAKMIVVSAEEGDVGIMRGHCNMIASLRVNSAIRIYEEMDSKSREIKVSGGYFLVNGESVKVAVDNIIS